MVAEADIKSKKFANKKYYQESFKGLKLQHADFRGTTLIECDFTDADARYANFEGAVCYGSNFTNAILTRTNFKDSVLEKTIFRPKDCYGMTITLQCQTYSNMEVDSLLIKIWTFIPLVMKLEPALESKLIQFLGESTYLKYKEIFDRRII